MPEPVDWKAQRDAIGPPPIEQLMRRVEALEKRCRDLEGVINANGGYVPGAD